MSHFKKYLQIIQESNQLPSEEDAIKNILNKNQKIGIGQQLHANNFVHYYKDIVDFKKNGLNNIDTAKWSRSGGIHSNYIIIKNKDNYNYFRLTSDQSGDIDIEGNLDAKLAHPVFISSFVVEENKIENILKREKTLTLDERMKKAMTDSELKEVEYIMHKIPIHPIEIKEASINKILQEIEKLIK